MDLPDIQSLEKETLEHVLGYLNYSSGTPDAKFLSGVNRLYAHLRPPERPAKSRGRKKQSPPLPPWQRLGQLLRSSLEQLRTTSPAFTNADQAAAVLDIVQEQLIPKYREFHSDLLYHQDDAFLFGPFAWGRFCEAILQQGPPWDEQDRIVAAALNQLNDYLGYRPIPILEGHKIEPYPHERLRPVPVYVREAGVAAGRYHDVVTCALQILRDSDQSLREASCFAPEVLEELAVDPRAYDFDHPVNKRPNYHFGQWDPHRIDNKGRYTRYIIQQVSLDALMARIDDRPAHPHDELVFEAAAVLAGTMLMAAGVSGSGPQTWDSSVTLASLVPRIAAYRDIFYEQLLHNMSGPHVERLRQESIELHQPFGGARQHLNAQLSHRRAMQLAHVHLAQVFARIGYLEAAKRQAAMVPVAAARIQCRIDCRLTAGQQALERGNMHEALDHLNLIRDLLRKGIECGAIVDPWNILGFDGNFSLFPAMENSVHDHRVDDLLGTMDRIFGLYARVWSESAAADETEICDRAGKEYEEVCQWWHQFAVHEVASVQSPPALELYHAARVVADALNRWHRGGATTGDVKFWSPYVDMFDSPKAYALAVEALLEKDDFVSSMSLLVHWLSKAPEVSLEGGNTSFHMLGRMWLNNLIARLLNNDEASPPFSLVRKFLDYLEANANEYWSVPQFRLASGGSTGSQRKPRMGDPRDTESAKHNDEDGEEEEEENHRTDGSDGLYSAAYEDVVYQDSTDDGVEGPVFDFDHSTEEELEAESERIVDRLAFLDTIARLWRTASVACVALVRKYDNLRNDLERVTAALDAWKTQARRMRNELSRLLEMLHEHPLVASGISHESMVQYDRRRLVKETLMEQIMATAVEMNDSLRFILGARRSIPGQESWDDTQDNAPEVSADIHVEDRQIAHLIAAAIQGNIEQARADCSQLCQDWSNKKILYVPLAKGGSPIAIVEARVRQKALENQLIWLPRMGLFTEARELMDVARAMERNVPIGPGAVTQFDEVFETGYRSMVENIERASAATASAGSDDGLDDEDESDDARLVACLERLTESLLVIWLEHSRTLRLSVLEKVRKKDNWEELVQFIQTYGSDLFTQKFLNLGNVRAIMHQGAGAWLQQLKNNPIAEDHFRLVRDLDGPISLREAEKHMTLILEAIVENYNEYRDYNSTTTQSDRGDMLYTLFDFLRLRVAYDRIVWNLKPIVLAHEILVRRGRNEAAQLWRRALSERISEEADQYLRRLSDLQKKYAMRMPSVADRLGERFLRPMIIDRMRALVEPAWKQAGEPEVCHSFEILEEECTLLLKEPTGSGLDAPPWLTALEEEIESIQQHARLGDARYIDECLAPRYPIDLDDVEDTLDDWQ